MGFLYFKSLHVIFVVTWFAGLFYIVRLFIYQTEALEKSEPDRSILGNQLNLMAKRLWYIITWPSAIITLVFGMSLLFHPPYHYYKFMPLWLWLKLAFVLGLFVYHLYCHKIYLKLQAGIKTMSSQQLRLFNELSTLFLFSIVFLVIMKSALDMIWGMLGLLGLAAILMIAIRLYKRSRKS